MSQRVLLILISISFATAISVFGGQFSFELKKRELTRPI
jgi:hypothetical protein